jgi:SAM-dependent methyltransferase
VSPLGFIPTDVTDRLLVAPEKQRVREFWGARPCGSKHAEAPEGSPEYFDQVERRRDELEPFITRYADFAGAAGKDVLEIGVGLGTDFIRFARAGANATGIDLTDRAVELVRRRLELAGLTGEVRVADAEQLPFDSGSFDIVYSWGVLHHTPDTAKSIREALRVAKPGGRVCVMLYARHSWVAYGLWLRYALARGRPWRSLSSVLADHMESSGTKGYTVREVRAMFTGLDDLSVVHVGTPYDGRIVGPIARWTGSRLGWFLVIRGHRAAN